MGRHRSLNAYVDQHQVLPLLDVAAGSGAIPTHTECPLCHGPRLTIFDDTRFGGNWHHCPDCKSTGDLISLAARYWKCAVATTVQKLADLGATIPEELMTDERIKAYVHWHTRVQRNCAALLEDASAAIHAGRVNVDYILQQIGISAEHVRSHWPTRMGQFIGGASCKRVYDAFYRPRETRAEMSNGARLFKGKGWHDVVTIPFNTLPGQFAGWLFVGRQGRPNVDYDFQIIDSYSRWDDLIEIGVCMYNTLDMRTAYGERFGDNVFVFNDPLLALRLQSRHARDSDLPLPVVGTYNAKVKRNTNIRELVSYNIWRSRPDKKFIFWGATLSADLFNMAARANGRVYVSRLPLYVGRQPPHEWLALIQKNAMDWQVALESYLRGLDDAAAVSLLSGLRIAPEIMQQFRANCGATVARLLDRSRHKVQLLGTVRVNSKDIVETESGWYTAGKREECITNAIIRMEKILCMADDPDADIYVTGRILYGSESYDFHDTIDRIEHDPGSWLRKQMLAKAQKLVVVKRGWNNALLDIARQFHEPEVVSEDGRFGWKPQQSCFMLPRFSVHVGGQVKEQRAQVVDDWAPGRHLSPPAGLVDLKPLLRDSPANRLFWAVTSCVAANILAPAMGQRVAGLGLLGHGGLLLGRATARTHGCKEIRVGGATAHQGSKVAARIEMVLERHAWPLIINCDRHGSSRTLLGPWQNGDYNRNAILHMTRDYADLAATLDSWRFIHEDQPIPPSPEIRSHGPYVLPTWLERMCRDKLELDGDDPYVFRVARSLAKMMEDYGNAHVVHMGAAYVDDGSFDVQYRARHLITLLYKFIETGALRFVHNSEADRVRAPKVVLIDDAAQAPGVFLSREALDQVLLKHKLMLPDPGRITSALQISNALDRECLYNKEAGWLIIESWWNRQIETCRASRHQLSVIGGE